MRFLGDDRNTRNVQFLALKLVEPEIARCWKYPLQLPSTIPYSLEPLSTILPSGPTVFFLSKKDVAQCGISDLFCGADVVSISRAYDRT